MSNNSQNTQTPSNPLISFPIATPGNAGAAIDATASVTKPTSVPVDANLYKEAADLAYPLAIESYKEAERRLDVVEKRLQELIAFAVTITLGLIAACAGRVNVQTWPFALAMVFCIFGIIVGIYARLSGNLTLLSMNSIYNNYITKSDAEFKMTVISWSGENNNTNAKAIKAKATLTNIAAILFLGEWVVLGLWAGSRGLSESRQHSAPTPAQAAVAAGQSAAGSGKAR